MEMALFVVQNSGPLKFHLLGLKKPEYDKYRNLITENGGEISPTGNYPVINFSLPGCFEDHKFVIHVCYIEDCIRENRILNLIDFIISEKNGYEGCPLSSLIFGDLHCRLAFVSLPLTPSKNDADDKLVGPSASDVISCKESNSTILNITHEDYDVSNDSVVSNSTDNSLENTTSRSSYQKFSNLTLMKD